MATLNIHVTALVYTCLPLRCACLLPLAHVLLSLTCRLLPSTAFDTRVAPFDTYMLKATHVSALNSCCDSRDTEYLFLTLTTVKEHGDEMHCRPLQYCSDNSQAQCQQQSHVPVGLDACHQYSRSQAGLPCRSEGRI